MAIYTLTVNPDSGYWKLSGKTDPWSSGTRTVNLEEGSSIELINPIRKGYKFISWQLSSASSYIVKNVYTQGAENCTITAIWSQSAVEDAWNTEISKVFREPGDFRYQLVSGEQPDIGTFPDDVERQWLMYSSNVSMSGSIFRKSYNSTVGNGSWILDGTLTSVCENNVFNNNVSEVARRYTLPATWDIAVIGEIYSEICQVPTSSYKLSIVWDPVFQGFPTKFTLQGINRPSATEVAQVWSEEIENNTEVISVVDIWDHMNPTAVNLHPFQELRIIAKDWNHADYTPPTLTAMYFGYTEDSETKPKGVLNVKHTTSTNLYSNELSSQGISIENSNLSYYRDINRDLLLESSLPGNSLIFVQYGLTYSDGNIYYTDVYKFATSKYSAPTDTQTVTIEGVDPLATNADVFKFNNIPQLAEAVTLETVITHSLGSTGLQVDSYDWPIEVRSGLFATYSEGALPKDTPVTQVYQYIAQILGAIVYADPTTGAIKAVKVADLTSPVPYELNPDITTSWPSVTLHSQINRIDIKKYKVCNTHEDLYGVVYSTQIAVPAGSDARDIEIKYANGTVDPNGPTAVQITNADTADSTAFSYEVVYTGLTFTHIRVTYPNTSRDGQFNVEVLGYPGYAVFDTIQVIGTRDSIITITRSWDNARRNLAVYRQDSKFEILDNVAGAYYYKLRIKLLVDASPENPIYVELLGTDVAITSEIVTYWDNSAHSAGETLTIDNPLISTDYVLNKVGEFTKALVTNRKQYKLDYLGDPTLNALDTRKIITDRETLDNFIVTKSELTFNGGYSGTLEGRTI